MGYIVFIVLSALYVATLAVVDGLFNRLIFRELRDASYFSEEKSAIYKRPEWRAIGVLFLIVLPVIIPAAAAYALGGWRYVGTYAAILLLVQWDIIFGKIVFGRWLGDTPSIAVPKIGWVHLPLIPTVAARIAIACLLILFLSWF